MLTGLSVFSAAEGIGLVAVYDCLLQFSMVVLCNLAICKAEHTIIKTRVSRLCSPFNTKMC